MGIGSGIAKAFMKRPKTLVRSSDNTASEGRMADDYFDPMFDENPPISRDQDSYFDDFPDDSPVEPYRATEPEDFEYKQDPEFDRYSDDDIQGFYDEVLEPEGEAVNTVQAMQDELSSIKEPQVIEKMREEMVDGALASTNIKTGVISVAKGVTKVDVLDHITKGTSEVSQQKQVVNQYIQDEFDIDFIGSVQEFSDVEAKKFVIEHEKVHLRQKNLSEYFKDPARTLIKKYKVLDNKYMSDTAIRAEAEANVEALRAVKEN
tara:strand:+ start:1302 stop:2087 length:786 start_codon:yes stop_codon:yes gene_type:complete